MKRNYFSILFPAGLFLTFIILSLPGAGAGTSAAASIKKPGLNFKTGAIRKEGIVRPDLDFGTFPLYFIANQGQVDKQAAFYARTARYTLWMTNQGLVFDRSRSQNPEAEKDHDRNPLLMDLNGGDPKGRGGLEPAEFSRSVSRLLFIGANKKPGIVPLEESKLKVNYFKGSDRSKWHCDVPTSLAVLYKNLYNNIDLKVYGVERSATAAHDVTKRFPSQEKLPDKIQFSTNNRLEGMIEYDWIVKPGANPADIKFEYIDVKGTRIDKKGDLVIETEFGELIHKKPVSFQTHPAPSGHLRSSPKGGESDVGARRAVPETDRRDLIHQIHRNPNHTTHGKKQNLESRRDHVDVTFKKLGKNTYGFSVGRYDKTRELVIDPVVLVYSTYLGGVEWDVGRSIAIDSSGYAYLTGNTAGTDFPIRDQFQSYQGEQGYHDAFVTKIDMTQAGDDSLIYSTYLGGEFSDFGSSIAVDDNECVYVIGSTRSSDFPTMNQYQNLRGVRDVFITKIDTTQAGSSGLIYSTFVGGSWWDGGDAIAVDGNGYVYAAGTTESTDFPILNQYQTRQDRDDAFVLKIDPNQVGESSLIYSTYLGGLNVDYGYGIVVDNSENVYITGYTEGAGFPSLNRYRSYQGEGDAFIAKIDTTQSGLSSLVYATYIGGSDTEVGHSITIDSGGYVYVTGLTYSTNFPILNQYQAHQGESDVFVLKMDLSQPASSSLLYSTYLGGSDSDTGFAITVDDSGTAYVTGGTHSRDFPTLKHYQAYQGDSDCFVSKINTTKTGTASLIHSTYLGGEDYDRGSDIAIDGNDNIYIMGTTRSVDFPVLNHIHDHQGNFDTFVTKLAFASITLTSPNGGEEWGCGTTHNITWAHTGPCSDRLAIILKQNDKKIAVIAKNIDAASGSYTWRVGDCLKGTVTPGTGYKIIIGDKIYRTKDSSNASFSIKPVLRVTSPDGGENWQQGTTHDITWNAEGLTNNVIIILEQNGTKVALIAKGIEPDRGFYSWTVGECRLGSVSAGTNYKILIKEKDSTVHDRSNAAFTITE